MDCAIAAAAPGLTGAAAHGLWNTDMLGLVLGTIAGAGLAFQVGHFAEHAIQFGKIGYSGNGYRHNKEKRKTAVHDLSPV